MDLLTFVAEMTKALAWPVTSLAAAWFFRRALYGLIPELRRLAYKDFSMDFGKELANAKAEAPKGLPEAQVEPKALPLPAGAEGQAPKPLSAPPAALRKDTKAVESQLDLETRWSKRIREFAKWNPGGAIQSAWALVEEAIDRALLRAGVAPPLSAEQRSMALEKHLLIESDTLMTVNKLRTLSSASQRSTERNALDYADLAMQVARYLDAARPAQDTAG